MRISFFILSMIFMTPIISQNLEGTWLGQLWQNNSTDTFSYQLTIIQNGEAVSGRAISVSSDGAHRAEFILSGRWANGALTLQEVQQTSPSAPQWCLKYIHLTQSSDHQFTGNWTAKGCQPGQLNLIREGTHSEEVPFSYLGRWSGHLTQSDREYGFYFEVNLQENGVGSSHIVSEGAGGEATHALTWREENGQIICTESHVAEKTDEKWSWCLKSYTLQMNRSGTAFEMTGDWGGYLENKTPASGACAPGTVFLNKPVLSKTIETKIEPEKLAYTDESGRSVKVDRVISVKNHNIRLRVWDNGIVDGDVVTLFLNGERIVNDYRVRKTKWSIPVTVKNGENMLILHAEDLGDISPNTVAVAIDDGVEEQVVILSSNLRESGAILIQPFVLED